MGTQTGTASDYPWKLQSPPGTPVDLDANVLAMRVPLVRVRCEESGTWTCAGPDADEASWQRTTLSAVVTAWPHIAALSNMEPGGSVVWSWPEMGWADEDGCTCGECPRPVATDVDRTAWPENLQPDTVVSVENVALTGQTPLVDILHTQGGIALIGEGDHRRTVDLMSPVAMANVVRRWPHTVQALRMLQELRGMRWNFDELNWREYRLAY
ncbi:hypothetical protein [Salinifilum ghardaiensis]